MSSVINRRSKEPIQLDLFEPVQQGHEFKVIVTNKITGAGKVARFHEGRGYQEKIYGELKNQAQMGYVPARRLAGSVSKAYETVDSHVRSRLRQWLRRTRALRVN
jgi:hypothetical protein